MKQFAVLNVKIIYNEIMKIKNNGFTLIELLVVVLIIGILVAIALPDYRKAVNKSRLAEAVLLTKSLDGSVRFLANREISGQGREIANLFSLSGASWDADGLIYSTKIHSLDIACQDGRCVAHVYYPKKGTPLYTLTFTGEKDQDTIKTCQGPDYICEELEDKGFTKI